MDGDRPDPYEVLGVPSTATADQIARAYRRLARRLHPDTTGDAADAGRFGEVAQAYATLADPAQRAEHDRRAARPAARAGAVRVPVRRVVRARRGADVRVDVVVPFERAVLGGPVEVDVPGHGRMTVHLPAGVGGGQFVRVAALGGGGSDGGRPGDLLLCVRVEPDARFTLAGDDVRTTARIRWTDAALGGAVEVEAPGGPALVRVPAGTPPGAVLRIPRRGVPPAGDLLVTVAVDVPAELDPAEREAVERLAAVLRPPRR